MTKKIEIEDICKRNDIDPEEIRKLHEEIEARRLLSGYGPGPRAKVPRGHNSYYVVDDSIKTEVKTRIIS